MQHTGIVKWYDADKGYGIIVDQSGEDVFLHHSRIMEYLQEEDLTPGMQVSFDMAMQQDVIPSAQNVQLLQ